MPDQSLICHFQTGSLLVSLRKQQHLAPATHMETWMEFCSRRGTAPVVAAIYVESENTWKISPAQILLSCNHVFQRNKIFKERKKQINKTPQNKTQVLCFLSLLIIHELLYLISRRKLFERQREIETGIQKELFQSAQQLGLAKLKPGAWNLTQVSHMSASNPST